MKKKLVKNSTVLTSAMFVLSILLAIPILTVQASPGTKIYLEPSDNIFDAGAVSIGHKFNVTVKVQDVTDLAAWQVCIVYNETILNVTRWFEPTWDSSYVFHGKGTLPIPYPPEYSYKHIAPGNGSATVSAALFPPGQPSFTGSGKLCILEFEIKAIPPEGETYSCELAIDKALPYNTFLLDTPGDEIPCTKENGYYEITWAPPPPETRLYVYPPEIIDPTLGPSSTFTINITIDDIANMVICEFNLTYDTDVLSWVGIEILEVSGEPPSAEVDCSDEKGDMWFKLNYTTPVTTDSPLPLVSIMFHVESFGETPLDLHDTELTDSSANPIPHVPEDGYFAALIHDVAITNVVPSHIWAYPGWLVDILLTAKNKGMANETFEVKAYYNDTLIGALPVIDLMPSEEINKTITWDTTGVSEGVYTIKGEATTVLFEINTTDNIYIDDTVEIKVIVRDVAIIDIVKDRDWVYQGRPVEINVTAKNLGMVFAETFNVSVYYDGNLIGTTHVVDLAPNTNITLTFTWNTSEVTPCNNYTITGEATTVPYEFDITNNIYSDGTVKVRFLGDLNGDGMVNMKDVYKIVAVFGLKAGHPKWNPDADLNQDGLIDMRDIYLAIRNFAKICRP